MSAHILDSLKISNRIELQRNSSYPQVFNSGLNRVQTANCTAYPPEKTSLSGAVSRMESGVEKGGNPNSTPTSTATLTSGRGAMKATQLRIPLDRRNRPSCGNRSPYGFPCTRPVDHTGRHHFARRHLDGKVREVWG